MAPLSECGADLDLLPLFCASRRVHLIAISSNLAFSMKAILADTAERAARYLDQLQERTVAPDDAAVDNLSQFDEPLPALSTDPLDTIKLLEEIGSPATAGMPGPRFFGFVIGGSLPAALAANWLTSAWDQSTTFAQITPGTAAIEWVARGWLLDLLKLPPSAGVGFVTGATMANFTSLAAARSALLQREGWNADADGLFGAPPITVIVGEEVHVSLLKALGLVGFGRKRVYRVPVDDQGRMRADALPRIEGPTIICTQAGNVNTGAIDPIGSISDIAHEAGAWVHVDGAFGMWAAAAPTRAHLTQGMEKADSWATDAHKWLNVPYDSGIAFVRDPHALRTAMSIAADYLPTTTDVGNPADFTPEISRRARGVDVWAALRQLGRQGVEDLIERCCQYAARFAEGLRTAGYQILNDVVLNQVLVSFGDAETTRAVIDGVQRDGTCWVGGTVWQGQTAMRISVSNWSTTEEDVERSLEAIIRVARVVTEGVAA